MTDAELKVNALLEDVNTLTNQKADLRVQVHNLTLKNQELQNRVNELEEEARVSEDKEEG